MNPASSEANNKLDEYSTSATASIDLYHIEDATISLRIFGQGPALVLIHGFPVHGYTWRKLPPTLSERFTCYVVDLPGLGDSDWSSNTDLALRRRLDAWVSCWNH